MSPIQPTTLLGDVAAERDRYAIAHERTRFALALCVEKFGKRGPREITQGEARALATARCTSTLTADGHGAFCAICGETLS